MSDDLMDTLDMLMAETNRMERLRDAVDRLDAASPHRQQLLLFMQRRLSGLDGCWQLVHAGSYIAGRA